MNLIDKVTNIKYPRFDPSIHSQSSLNPSINTYRPIVTPKHFTFPIPSHIIPITSFHPKSHPINRFDWSTRYWSRMFRITIETWCWVRMHPSRCNFEMPTSERSLPWSIIFMNSIDKVTNILVLIHQSILNALLREGSRWWDGLGQSILWTQPKLTDWNLHHVKARECGSSWVDLSIARMISDNLGRRSQGPWTWSETQGT
jgi:hypothetical protein